MKNKMTLIMALILVSLTIMPFSGCKKDSLQDRFPRYIFFSQGSDYILVTAFPGIDVERAKAQPEPYDTTMERYYKGFKKEWDEHILAELDAFTAEVNTDFRTKPQDHWAWMDREKKWTAAKAYDYQDAGFDPRFFELLEGMLEALHGKIRNYVLNVVDGPYSAESGGTSGSAQQTDRDAILNFLSQVDPKNKYEMTYEDEVKAMIRNYVVTGKKPVHHSRHRNGWFLFRAEKW